MPIEHPPPTEATVKLLYAHAFGCAFGGCRRTLYKLDDETGVRRLNSRICHINARREGGPRWDPNQSPEENRSEQNLVLMCVEHAAAIDIPQTLSNYPAVRLREWKRDQLEQYGLVEQGWTLDENMAREVIETSLGRADVIISNSTVILGGKGGKAPGAGGGGGGAVGRGARAGRGGDGGGHRIDDGEYTLPWPEDKRTHLDSDELARLGVNYIPGAGGGGQGAVGDGASAGDGGMGGEAVAAAIDIAEMEKYGFHHAEVVVGKGGEGGGPGGDSFINFVTEDGTVLRTLRAPGGKRGGSTLPEGVLEITPEDIHYNFRATTFTMANAVEIREGLFFLLGADWEKYVAPSLPFDALWPVVCALRWTARQWPEPRGLFLSLLRPDGAEAGCQAVVFPAESGLGGCFHWVHKMSVKLDVEGTWTLRLHSGGFMLAQLDLRVTTPPST
jgi:hypothetical protein